MFMGPNSPSGAPTSDFQTMALELERFREILDTASDAVVSANQNHEVVYMNRAAEKLFGYQRSEMLGRDLSPLIPTEHRQQHRHYLERYVRTRQARLMGHSAQVEAEHRDGSRVPISISFSVAENGPDLLFTAIMRDLSTQRKLAAKVDLAERLAAVGQMVATVTHEIKTPLALIGGFANQLKKEPGLSEKGLRKLGIIVEEVARLENMLVELGDLSRPQRYVWNEIDLAQLVGHVKALMAPQLKRNRFFLKVNATPGLPPIMGDKDKLSQVLINLINNAIQAGGPNDEVKLELNPAPNGQVELLVRDWGCGIPEQYIEDIFTPFFTTKKRGTGLGLPVAKRIIDEHGGSLEMLSSPENGTTARVLLPPAPAVPTLPTAG